MAQHGATTSATAANGLHAPASATPGANGAARRLSFSSAVAASRPERSVSGRHAATLEALLPKARDVVVAPGTGISCMVSVDQLAAVAAASAPSGGPAVAATPANPLEAAAAAAGPPPPPPPPGSRNGLVRVVVGNRLLMQQEGVEVPPEAESYITPMETTGHTCVLAALNGRLAGVVAIADPLKPEAAGVVSALRARGIQCIMITGDNWRTARALASQVRASWLRGCGRRCGAMFRLLQNKGEGNAGRGWA